MKTRITNIIKIHPEGDVNFYQISWESVQYLLRHLSKNEKCQPHGGARGQGITNASRIHPLGTLNVCTKCHVSP